MRNHIHNRSRLAVGAMLAMTTTLFAACGGGGELGSNENCSAAVIYHADEIARTGRFLVQYNDGDTSGLSIEDSTAYLRHSVGDAARVEAVRRGLYTIQTDADQSALEKARELLEQPGVAYIEPDYELQGFYVTNDPAAEKQWAHEKVNSFGAWDIGRGSQDVVVGVIDSGVDYTHPDLAGNMWRNPDEVRDGKDNDGNGFVDDVYGWDFRNEDSYPMADDRASYHGTHVAGTIGAVGDDGYGIVGHSPNVRIMALKFLGSNKAGYGSDAVRAIDYAIAEGVDVINASYGSSNYSQAMRDAIERANQAGILFVAAAGNIGNNIENRPMYPAAYDNANIIRVAASDQDDVVPSWSNYGPSLVDLAAPGRSIYSTQNNEGYKHLSGTSMAAPLVSGVAALLIGQRPDLSHNEIKSAILDTVDMVPGMDRKVRTGGRINAARAMQAVNNAPPGENAGKPGLRPVPIGDGRVPLPGC